MLCDFLLCSDEDNIFKTCEILVWLKNCTSMLQLYDSRPKTELDIFEKGLLEGKFSG